jgi:hypothetical protein
MMDIWLNNNVDLRRAEEVPGRWGNTRRRHHVVGIESNLLKIVEGPVVF